MAATTKIGRLTARIESVARRFERRLRMNDLTEAAWERINRRRDELLADAPPANGKPTSLCHWTDEELIRVLLAHGWLASADFKLDRQVLDQRA